MVAVNDSEPVETEVARSILDQLLEDSRLYRKGADYKNLLDFAVRLRNFAPFNALLLQIQKPGLNHAASARDWREKFGRTIKDGARPLLILWPFGPVALVYDLMDTDGGDLPSGVTAFEATGTIDKLTLAQFEKRLSKKNIAWSQLDAGDRKAGSIALVKRPVKTGDPSSYKMAVNKNHDPNVQFTTVAHELAHLFLGHIGCDEYLRIPERRTLTHDQRELEAESTAFVVCARNGVECKSQKYLASYVTQDTTTEKIDLYQIMRAAGQVETILGLAAQTKLDRPAPELRKSAAAVDQTSDIAETQAASKAKMMAGAKKLAALLNKDVRVRTPTADGKVTVVESDNGTFPLFPDWDENATARRATK